MTKLKPPKIWKWNAAVLAFILEDPIRGFQSVWASIREFQSVNIRISECFAVNTMISDWVSI